MLAKDTGFLKEKKEWMFMLVFFSFFFLPQSNKEIVMILALVSIHSWKEAKIDNFLQP